MGEVAKPGQPRREIVIEPITVPAKPATPSTPAPERQPEKVPA
jgi:hypothetical protein